MNAPGPYPHPGGCPCCRAERRCNSCGAYFGHGAHFIANCTNGRCMECHDAYCTIGGSTSPGHGFGTRGNPFANAGH